MLQCVAQTADLYYSDGARHLCLCSLLSSPVVLLAPLAFTVPVSDFAPSVRRKELRVSFPERSIARRGVSDFGDFFTDPNH